MKGTVDLRPLPRFITSPFLQCIGVQEFYAQQGRWMRDFYQNISQVFFTRRGVQEFYVEEGRRMRDLSQIKAEAMLLLKKCKARSQRILFYEGNVMQDMSAADQECRVHAQMMQGETPDALYCV